MKAVCDGLNLSVAVLNVLRAISGKGLSQVLEGIKIVAKNDYLELSATDTEISIEQRIPSEVLIEGEIVVPGKYFADFIRKLDHEQIELSLINKTSLKIKYSESEGTLQTYDVEEFPEINKVSENDYFTISQKEMKDLINKSEFCAAQDDSRPVFKGILFEIEKDSLRTVALDGYRLALINKRIENTTKNSSIIVPARALKEITSFLNEDKDTVNVYFDNKKLMLEINAITFITRLIDGDFIKYQNIIPQSFNTTVIFNRDNFEDSLERASVLSKSSRNNIATFDITEENMIINCVSEIGNIKEKMQIQTVGRDVKIAFNPKFVGDAIKVIKEESATLKINTDTTPAAIMPIEGDDFFFMILPIRVAG